MPSVPVLSEKRSQSSVQVPGLLLVPAVSSRKRPLSRLISDEPTLLVPKSEPDSDDQGTGVTEKPKRKRQRLDHLSQEEKTMRRKLKNRVAAQYARDRKKVLVDEMAITISDLRRDKQHLVQENDLLKQRNERLVQQVESLRQALVQAGARVPAVSDETENRTFESAALICDRQPRDQVLPTVPSDGPAVRQSESSSNFFSCLMLTMASLTIASSQLGQKTSSPSPVSQPVSKCSLMSLAAESGAGDRRDGQWWGRQQQSWNPAQIHVPYIQ